MKYGGEDGVRKNEEYADLHQRRSAQAGFGRVRRSKQDSKENFGGAVSPHGTHASNQGDDSNKHVDALRQSNQGIL